MACKEVIDICKQNMNGRVLNFTAIGDAKQTKLCGKFKKPEHYTV